MFSSVMVAVLAGGSATIALAAPAAAADAYPFAARVTVGAAGSGAGCSGALVDPRWVLTAKQCFVVDGQPVTAGPPKRATTVTLGGVAMSATHIAPHPQRDVVMVQLAAAVDTVTPVPLAASGPVPGETLRLAGFGRTKTEWVPDALHTGEFTVSGVAGDLVQVAGKDADQVGPCKGDAGGPGLRVTGNRAELVALTATGGQGGCFGGPADGGKSATQTRVDDLGGWVREQVAATEIALIANENSKKCLGIGSGSTENAAHAIQWQCSGATDQDWRLHLRADGKYEIRNDNSNQCLGIERGSKENSAHAIQWPCRDATLDQKWLLERTGTSTRLRNANSNQCLAIGGGNVENGAHALQWPCTSNRDQWWTVKTRVQGRDVRNEHSGLCVSTVDWTGKGSHAVQAACSNANSAEWQIHATTDGYAQVRNDRSGQCLAIGDSSTADGWHALQWPCADTNNDQQWRVDVAANGLTQLRNRNSGKCLTIDGGVKTAGAHLVQQPCNSAKTDQFWRL
ncbi:RICIN domain-containing protein [Actinoplanes sp. NPDC051859]|uniref:RICIN domain-containing protein n=1 Tax=Actinoplanes sp. NPDC051859 TaxID=3363909 RepID=UPI0037926481